MLTQAEINALIAGAVAANLFIAPNDPAVLLRGELATRVRAAEGAIASRLGEPTNEPPVAPFATMGTARLLALVRSAEILHSSVRQQHAEQVARITLVDRLVTGAAALEILWGDPPAGERRVDLRSRDDGVAVRNRRTRCGPTDPSA